MLIDCPELSYYRNSCGVGPFVQFYCQIFPHISSCKIYALYLNDDQPDQMQRKAYDLYHMKIGWHSCMNIEL